MFSVVPFIVSRSNVYVQKSGQAVSGWLRQRTIVFLRLLGGILKELGLYFGVGPLDRLILTIDALDVVKLV